MLLNICCKDGIHLSYVFIAQIKTVYLEFNVIITKNILVNPAENPNHFNTVYNLCFNNVSVYSIIS